jgi:hypothetical protein
MNEMMRSFMAAMGRISKPPECARVNVFSRQKRRLLWWPNNRNKWWAINMLWTAPATRRPTI